MNPILLLFCLLFIFNCKGTSLNPEISNHDIKNKPDILNQIESRSLRIQNSDGLENVYYLAVEDSINNLLGVAYFLDWSNEFPDFGKIYETNSQGLIEYDDEGNVINSKPLDLSITKSVFTIIIVANVVVGNKMFNPEYINIRSDGKKGNNVI